MKRAKIASLFVTSIVVILAAVKARAADLPKVSKEEISQLVDHMMKHGHDSRFGDVIAPALGLPGPKPIKGDTVRAKKAGKKRGGLNVSVIYDESEKQPLGVTLDVRKASGLDREICFYRLDLDGQLDRVAVVQTKVDENGKTVQGSSIIKNEDINSPEVKKAFTAEMAEVRQWFKQQQKIAAKKAVASKTL